MNDISQTTSLESDLSREWGSSREIRNASKGAIRTFQTAVQKDNCSQQLLRGNSPASSINPPSITSTWDRRAESAEQTAMKDSVNSGFSSVNCKLSRMYSNSRSRNAVSQDNSDRAAYSVRAMRSWGSTVSAEISTFATQRVMPLFRRQHAESVVGIGSLSKGLNIAEVSFDYQLMIDRD